MGLACSQVRLLTLTSRKADCEFGISVDAMKKHALARETSQLSSEYQNRLKSKQVSVYSNGEYNKINYGYLMGYGANYLPLTEENSRPIKTENSMILSDYKGQVVLYDDYAEAIIDVIGPSVMNSAGQGSTFSNDNIAAILAALTGFKEEDFQAVIDSSGINNREADAYTQNVMTGEQTGSTSMDLTDNTQSALEKLVDFYYPIFAAAAANGWTTEYNKQMDQNEDYISDSILSGTFQLESVNQNGEYEEGTSLSYYITAGLIDSRNDSEAREEVTAWYNAEKERISEKETLIDLHMQDLSTELEAIKTEMQSIQSLIDDAISSVFDWGGG